MLGEGLQDLVLIEFKQMVNLYNVKFSLWFYFSWHFLIDIGQYFQGIRNIPLNSSEYTPLFFLLFYEYGFKQQMKPRRCKMVCTAMETV